MRDPQDMPYAIVLKDFNDKILMDWSPKSGCTIAVKMFFRKLGLLETALSYSDWIHNYRMHVFFIEQPTYREDLTDSDYFKFKVVRNPFSRVVSSYLHTMKSKSMHAPVKKVLKKWNSNISFNQFVNFLEKTDLSSLGCDPHYGLQKKSFENSEMNFDLIIKLENFKNSIDELNSKSGANFNIEGLKSEHHIKIDNNTLNKAYDKKFSRIIKQVPSYDQFYNEDLIRRVSELYQQDLNAYNYNYSEFENNLGLVQQY